jgi:hypothetical protein
MEDTKKEKTGAIQRWGHVQEVALSVVTVASGSNDTGQTGGFSTMPWALWRSRDPRSQSLALRLLGTGLAGLASFKATSERLTI